MEREENALRKNGEKLSLKERLAINRRKIRDQQAKLQIELDRQKLKEGDFPDDIEHEGISTL